MLPAHALPVRYHSSWTWHASNCAPTASRARRAAGLRAARAAGREPRAARLARRDHREGLGRARRLGRRRLEPRQVGAPGARRRRQGAALHPHDPRPGLPLRGAVQASRGDSAARIESTDRPPGGTRTDRRRTRAPVDRGAAVPPGRRRRALCRHRRRAAPRADQPSCRGCAGCSSSRAARRSACATRTPTSARSGGCSACATACRARSRSRARASS